MRHGTHKPEPRDDIEAERLLAILEELEADQFPQPEHDDDE